MSNFENLLTRLIQNPRFFLTFLVGSLLCFVPIVHFFAFGYIYRMTKILRVNGALEMPEWEESSRLFIDGIRLTIVLLVYGFLPITLGLIIIKLLIPNLAYNSVNIFLGFWKLAVLSLFCSAFYRYQRTQNFYELLNFTLIFRMAVAFFKSNFLVLVLCYGLAFLLTPLYGFSIFSVLLAALIQSTYFFYGLDIKGGRAG
tara:strand:+ start:1017 stop:1616 length:600 start_codon:yes stop_codon:yes gene_type:complete